MTNQKRKHLDPEDRRKHLDFLQAVVTRMSAASSTTKGWLLPVVTASYGYAATKPAAPVALLGVMAVVVFAIIDANYLNQERAFRRLYDLVALENSVPPFAMDPSLAATPTQEEVVKWWLRGWTIIRRWVPAWTVWSSWAIAPFYGLLLVVGVGIFFGVR